MNGYYAYICDNKIRFVAYIKNYVVIEIFAWDGADVHKSEMEGDLYYIANLMLDTENIDIDIKRQMIVKVLDNVGISKRDREWAAKKYLDLKGDD